MSFKTDFDFISKYGNGVKRVNDKKDFTVNNSVNAPFGDIFQRSDFSIEKESYIKSSELLTSYKNAKFERSYKEISFNLLDNAANVKDLSDIEAKCKTAREDFANEYKYDKMPDNMLKILVDTEHFSPETYKHITSSQDNKRSFKRFCKENEYGSGVYHCIKNLSPGAIEEIKKAQKDFPGINNYKGFSVNNSPYINMYIANPLHIYDSNRTVRYLSDILAQNTTDSELNVLRAERNTEIFSETPVSETLQKKIKKTCFFNQFKTRKEKLYSNSAPIKFEDSLYNHIKNKERLSLSDAMIMMRYLDSGAQSDVLESVRNASFKNKKFLSTTFCEEFTDKRLRLSSRTNILNEITIPKGTQGIYINKPNEQFEFLINNTEKEFKVTFADYDKEKNTFIIKTDMQETE